LLNEVIDKLVVPLHQGKKQYDAITHIKLRNKISGWHNCSVVISFISDDFYKESDVSKIKLYDKNIDVKRNCPGVYRLSGTNEKSFSFVEQSYTRNLYFKGFFKK